MKKTLVTLVLAGSIFFSGCSLITLETNPKTSEPEETVATVESSAETSSAETTKETEKTTETTAAETSATVSETTAA